MKKPVITENFLDKAIAFISPEAGMKRRHARLGLEITNSYVGASNGSNNRNLKKWPAGNKSANADIEPDRKRLIARSRDLVRNNALAAGAINTKVSNIVGTGLKPQPCIDYEFLKITDEQANEWENNTRREFGMWAESVNCDITRTSNFYELQDLAFRSVLENGDSVCLLPMKAVPGFIYETRLQLIEADRLCNEGFKADTALMTSGIQRDEFGAPTSYSILNYHPGDMYITKAYKWETIPAFGARTGRRNVIHLFRRLRMGQSRGIPDLAPVIELLRQLGEYTEHELTAAAVSSMFTVFVKSEGARGLAPMEPISESGGSITDSDYKLGSGAIVELDKGEDVTFGNPTRPNVNFDPFVQAILKQIGIALELPYEILIKHFESSYSAARASMLEAWRFFSGRRDWLASNFCSVVYEAWMWEAVAKGRIIAPGFLTDPAIRAAYLKAQWFGPARGQIDELKEAKAAEVWLAMGVKTLDQVTREETGADWLSNQRQRIKEVTLRRDAGLENDPTVLEPDEFIEPAPEKGKSGNANPKKGK